MRERRAPRTERALSPPADEAGPGNRWDRLAPAIVWLAVAGYAALFAWLSVLRHRAFSTGRFDLGNMVQAVWSTTQGRFLETTDQSGEQFVRLGAHVDPVLVLFAPLYAIWSSPESLLVAQAVIVSLGALPAFWLGRRWLGDSRLALTGAGAYLLYSPLQHATLFDFHPVTLAAPLLLFCIWAAEAGRWWTLAILATLTALTQEQVGLALVMLALWMAVRHPARRRAAAVLGVSASAWVALATLVIQPAFSLSGGNPHIGRYEALGSGSQEVIQTLLTRPWEAVAVMASPERGLYLLVLLVPLLGLSLMAPLLLAGCLPQLLINLLAGDGPAQRIEFHYTAVLVPFLVASAVLGLARLTGRDPVSAARPDRRPRRPAALARLASRPGLVAVALVGTVALAGIRLGPLPFVRDIPVVGWPGAPHHSFAPDAQARALAEAVSRVPEGASVAASNAPGAHLSGRERILLFPGTQGAEYIVATTGGRAGEAAGERITLRPSIAVVVLDIVDGGVGWDLVYEGDGVKLFQRSPRPPADAAAERPASTPGAPVPVAPPPAAVPSGPGTPGPEPAA